MEILILILIQLIAVVFWSRVGILKATLTSLDDKINVFQTAKLTKCQMPVLKICLCCSALLTTSDFRELFNTIF